MNNLLSPVTVTLVILPGTDKLKAGCVPPAIRHCSKVLVCLLLRPPVSVKPKATILTMYIKSLFCSSNGIGSHDNVTDMDSLWLAGGAEGLPGATAGAM